MRYKYIYTITLFFILSVLINARDWRVAQLPNGSKFSCANCHNDPAGGGARNKFGQEVEKRVSVGGTEQFWSASLAALDSDGDGKTNGSELQDASGAWRPGQSNPGTLSLVTNPGNASSVAVSTYKTDTPTTYKLLNNYPNPFNPETTISYFLPAASKISLSVYNLLGQVVAILVDNENKPAGVNQVYFNGSSIPSGTYIYKMEAADFVETKKMVLLK